ncbi:MAG: hypothetical protein QXG05_01515 [Nitrososphaerota archaeon]
MSSIGVELEPDVNPNRDITVTADSSLCLIKESVSKDVVMKNIEKPELKSSH